MFVDDFTRLRVQAVSSTPALMNPEQVAVYDHGTGDVGASRGFPVQGTVGDGAASSQLDGQSGISPAADHIGDSFVGDDARTDVTAIRNPFAFPELFASRGIDADHFLRQADDQFGSVCRDRNQ